MVVCFNISTSNIYQFIFSIVFLLGLNFGLAQEIRVVNSKGTISTVHNNNVTVSTAVPANPLENDIWFDNSDPSNIVTKVYDGATWRRISTGTAWNTLGNTGASGTINFLGTTDANPLVIKTNNIESARFTNEAIGTNSRFLLNPKNTWSGSSGSSNVIGINTTSNNQRLRLTSGSSDTQNDSQGASIDLFGNSTLANAGRLDLVGGSSASGTNNAITFWGNDGATIPAQAQRMVINGQGNVGIGNTSPNVTAVLDLTNTDQRALLLPSEIQPTNINSPTDGMIVYASGRTNAYLRADNVWKPIALNNVSNELIFDGIDDAPTANDNFYYVSIMINSGWKVIRYNKTDINDETEATGTGTQPASLASVSILTYN